MANVRRPAPREQRGTALVIGMIMLAVVTMLSVAAMKSAGTQEKMAFNLQDRQKALQAAESATRYAWSLLSAETFDVADFIDNASHTDYAPLYDLRATGTVSGNKSMSDWANKLTAASWPWSDATERGEIPSNQSIAAGNPMALASRPQFAIGMHAPVLRRGSEGRKCIPFSIVGAGRGSSPASQSLVKIAVIPKSGCFLDLVR